MHARDALEIRQEVLRELVRMGLVPSVSREKSKLDRKGLKVIGRYGSVLLWRWDSSRRAVTETLADDEGSGPWCESRKSHLVCWLDCLAIFLIEETRIFNLPILYLHPARLPSKSAYEPDSRTPHLQLEPLPFWEVIRGYRTPISSHLG